MKQNQKSIVSVLLALFLLLSLAGCSAFNVTAPKRTNWRTDSLGGVQYKVLRSWLKETPDTDAVKYTTKNSELTVTSSDEDVAAFSTYRGQRLRAIAIERELPDFGRASFRTEEIAGANAMVLNGSPPLTASACGPGTRSTRSCTASRKTHRNRRQRPLPLSKTPLHGRWTRGKTTPRRTAPRPTLRPSRARWTRRCPPTSPQTPRAARAP